MQRQNVARWLTPALALTVTVGLAGAAPVASAETAASVTRVTVVLAPPDSAALQRLADSPGLSHAQRVQALESLVPSAATREQVADRLRSEGLTLVAQTAWTVTASGSADTVADTFGTRPTLGSDPSMARYRRATGPLPDLPAGLSRSVAAVFPTRTGPAAFHHTATSALDGTDLRRADAPAGRAASTGTHSAGRTVATVQFADFYGTGPDPSATASDLTTYAQTHGIADPVGNGHYRAVTVEGGPSAADDAEGGDIEVNLDQQSILATAPSANQHAYFAPNTDAGFSEAFASVYDDVVGNDEATAPDPHIVALSSSWGACEAQTGASSIRALEPILESLAAAGVTVFSSSGDSGIYDCGSTSGTGADNHQADVDFPASSPAVVAVGGTHLSAGTSAANTGNNWHETAWACSGPVSCQSESTGTGGSGGGASGSAYSSSIENSFSGFTAPAYQRAGIDDTPFKGRSRRLVPDISADADPDTGFAVYTSDPEYVAEAGSHDVVVGGTSLATPVSAALFTNALAESGRATGVGDIHNGLYSAYHQTRSLSVTSAARPFRDVTSGSNGSDADKGTDPSVKAQAGFDTVSGTGDVLWNALVPYLVETDRPSVRATVTLPEVHSSGYRRVKASWAASQGHDSTLLAHTSVSIRSTGAPSALWTGTAVSGTHSFTGRAGRTYLVTVTATDLSGRTRTTTSSVTVPVDDSSFHYTGHWTRIRSSTFVKGSAHRTSTRNATARVTVTGSRLALRTRSTPYSGRVAVSLDGTRLKHLDLYSKANRSKLVTLYSGSRERHTLTFTVLGTKTSASKGARVTLDAVRVTG